ncbi:MAG TPA: hypothetical protein VL523_01745 [Terriglobia bacterium]|nr:hypothetical protein [Terriglobia bacterium]
MEHEGLLTAFVIVTAVAVVIQVVILFAVTRALTQLVRTIAQIQASIEQDLHPLMRTLNALATSVQEPTRVILGNLSEVSTLLRQRAASADAVVADLLDRARGEIIRVDELFTVMLAKIERAADAVERGVLVPVREVSAVIAGFRRGLGFFLSRRRTAKPESALHEEQLFI